MVVQGPWRRDQEEEEWRERVAKLVREYEQKKIARRQACRRAMALLALVLLGLVAAGVSLL